MKTILTTLTLAFGLVGTAASADVLKMINVQGGFSRATSSQMLEEIETDAIYSMAQACGSMDKVRGVNAVKITLETSKAIFQRKNKPGQDLFTFMHYPPSYLDAEVICAD